MSGTQCVALDISPGYNLAGTDFVFCRMHCVMCHQQCHVTQLHFLSISSNPAVP